MTSKPLPQWFRPACQEVEVAFAAGRLTHQRLEVGGVAARLLAGAHLNGGGLEYPHEIRS